VVTGVAGSWAVVGGTATGQRHLRAGTPNQDSSKWTRTTSRAGEVTILAVADGHGHTRYVRSGTGSELAVETACQVAEEAVREGLLDGPSRRLEGRVGGDVGTAIVERWRQACLDHLAAHPFTREERERADDPLIDEDPLVSYGSTILLAILGPSASVLLQLGDGDCLVTTADGRAVSPLPADQRMIGNETTSLCLPDATDEVRVAVITHLDPVLVVLASDGYGVAFADPEWRQTVMEDLRREFDARGVEHVERMLPQWLADSAEVGGDDATVLVAHRHRAASAAPKRHRAHGRAVLSMPVLGALLLGGMVGAAAGWAWGTPSDGVPTSLPTSLPLEPMDRQDPAVTPTDVERTDGVAMGTDGGLARGRIVGPQGRVVTFWPDPSRPDPEVEDVSTPPSGHRATTDVFLDQWWSLRDGNLFRDGEPTALLADPASMTFEALEAESGLLWGLVRGEAGLEWLVLIYTDGMWCRAFPVLSDNEGPQDPETEDQLRSPVCASAEVIGSAGDDQEARP
jgi:serine/threonine protein phosphatase PrpC